MSEERIYSILDKDFKPYLTILDYFNGYFIYEFRRVNIDNVYNVDIDNFLTDMENKSEQEWDDFDSGNYIIKYEDLVLLLRKWVIEKWIDKSDERIE